MVVFGIPDSVSRGLLIVSILLRDLLRSWVEHAELLSSLPTSPYRPDDLERTFSLFAVASFDL